MSRYHIRLTTTAQAPHPPNLLAHDLFPYTFNVKPTSVYGMGQWNGLNMYQSVQIIKVLPSDRLLLLDKC